MTRIPLIVVSILAVSLAACQREESTSRTPAPSPTATAEKAPSTQAVTPAPSDGKDPAFTQNAPKAGSAIGGTQGGNTTDPQSTPPPGGPVERRATPEPTGGDGTAQGQKAAPQSTPAPAPQGQSK